MPTPSTSLLKPIVVCCASQKGGTSKSTLARALSVACSRTGHTAALVDLDPQQTTAKWWEKREADAPALVDVTRDALAPSLSAYAQQGVQWLFVDTPPSHEDPRSVEMAIAVADLVLIPVRPSPDDLEAVGPTIGLARKHGKPFVFVVTQALARASSVADTAAALSEHGQVAPVIVGMRTAYSDAHINGRTASELDPRSKAAAEIAGLWAFVQARFQATPKARKPKLTTATA